MLYLNFIASATCPSFVMDLTLTSVVFEYAGFYYSSIKDSNLTLTSVVFESIKEAYIITETKKFNFNKCCI